MVGPVGFRIRTVGVWCEQFGWVAKRHRFSYNVNRGVTLRTPESTVESDRRGKRHAGNRGMAAQTRDARQDKTVRSGRPVATERALPPYGFTVACCGRRSANVPPNDLLYILRTAFQYDTSAISQTQAVTPLFGARDGPSPP